MTKKLYLNRRNRVIVDGKIPDCPLSPYIYAYKCAGSRPCYFYRGIYSIMGRCEVRCQLHTVPSLPVYHGKQATRRYDKQLGRLR